MLSPSQLKTVYRSLATPSYRIHCIGLKRNHNHGFHLNLTTPTISPFSTTTTASMKHHLVVGTWTPPGALFTFEFDDEALTLSLVKRTPLAESEPISWLTISHDKKTLYGAAMKKWSSHAIASPTDITTTASHPMSHCPEAAPTAGTRTRAIFALAAAKPPHCVYGAPFYEHADFGNIFTVDETGALKDNIQNFAYRPGSAIHGLVFDPEEEYLYSADMWENLIWTHKKAADGTLTTVDALEAPHPDDHPRWVEMHQSGKTLYSLMEKGNVLREYDIDPETHKPIYSGKTYPLVPEGTPALKKMYRADVVFCSSSGKYLFATSRSNKFGVPGYISTFALDAEGKIQRHISLEATPTSGGHSNAVAPCPWTDEWVALTDDEVGGIEIYRWKEEKLSLVARVDVKEPGFGMNAVWYD